MGGDLGSALKGFKKALSDDDADSVKKDTDKDADFGSVEDKRAAEETVKPSETKTKTTTKE